MNIAKCIFRFSIVAAAASTAGCGYTRVVPVDQHDRFTEGLRICETKPILIVTPASSQIQFIPNYSKMYAVQFGAFLAKNEFSIKVDNCNVTQLDSKLDSTAIIELLKSLAGELIPKPPAAKTTAGEPIMGPTAIIYEFIFDDYGNIVRLKPFPVGRGIPRDISAPKDEVKTTPKKG
jgi:galactitol-specific phosphotransferase system IIB component